MSLIDAKVLIHVPDSAFAAQTYGTMTIDATGERCGNILQIKRAGNIRYVSFFTNTVTTGDTIKVTLQTVDTSTGLPTGTLIDSDATGTVVVNDTDDNTWKTVDFGADKNIAVTQGQFIAVVLEWDSYVAGNIKICQAISVTVSSYNTYVVTDITATPGTWAKWSAVQPLVIEIGYDDGSYALNCDGNPSFCNTVTINSGTTPDEVGNYFQIPFPCRAVGIWVIGDIDYDVTLSLLDASDNILANCTQLAAYRAGPNVCLLPVFFDSSPASTVTIAKDTWYRVIMTPGANSVTIAYATVLSAAAMDLYPLGQNCHWTQATNRDEVTDWAQTTTKRCQIGLIIDQLDNGVSSGGSSPRFGDMTGGLK